MAKHALSVDDENSITAYCNEFAAAFANVNCPFFQVMRK
jgi:hypothetical protein